MVGSSKKQKTKTKTLLFGFSQKFKCTGISLIIMNAVSIQELLFTKLWDWIRTYSERYIRSSTIFSWFGCNKQRVNTFVNRKVLIKCSFLYSNRQSDCPAVIGPVCGGVQILLLSLFVCDQVQHHPCLHDSMHWGNEDMHRTELERCQGGSGMQPEGFYNTCLEYCSSLLQPDLCSWSRICCLSDAQSNKVLLSLLALCCSSHPVAVELA